MIKCTNCSEEIETGFTSCWKCGTQVGLGEKREEKTINVNKDGASYESGSFTKTNKTYAKKHSKFYKKSYGLVSFYLGLFNILGLLLLISAAIYVIVISGTETFDDFTEGSLVLYSPVLSCLGYSVASFFFAQVLRLVRDIKGQLDFLERKED